MAITLGPLGQIGIGASDVDKAEVFYGGVLGLRKLFRFGDLSFFDCAGMRLLIEKSATPGTGAVLYFRSADIVLARKALEERGAVFVDQPHRIAPMEDHDLWMTFCTDPDGRMIGLMMEAPKGYQPPG
jgi:methylmalonyl-CoA/ethylmalonyl-CoA epimerase